MLPCFERRDNCRRRCGVAQRNRNVAKPALESDSSYRTAFGVLKPGCFVPRKQIGQLRGIEAMPRREIVFCGWFGELVPRAEQLAIVAAVNAVADGLAKLRRNGALQLDSEVGNAATRIELVGRDDRLGRADFDTGGAAAAMVALIYRPAVAGRYRARPGKTTNRARG